MPTKKINTPGSDGPDALLKKFRNYSENLAKRISLAGLETTSEALALRL